MRGKDLHIKRSPERELDILLCDMTNDMLESPFSATKWVSSPLKCLDMAVDGSFRIIVIRFGRIPIRDRETLVDLSIVLKRNSHTRGYPMLALLHSRHRVLIENLTKIGVDYIRYLGTAKLFEIHLLEIIDELCADDRPASHLAKLCPFLCYSAIDSFRELKVCGAYLNRLILGGRRLQNICQTENHLLCEYYINPRCES